MMRTRTALTIRRVFTPAYRTRLREELVAAARADERITGVAVTGSSAAGNEDAWSDVDLAFGIGEPMAMDAAMDDWTARMYAKHGAVHHVDVVAGASIYRVFMLANTLQVDLAFSPASEFGAIAPSFKLLFGTSVERHPDVAPAPEFLIGYAWLYALHARSCIHRGRLWQGEYMISGVRDCVLSLACLRHNLPAAQGRGIDRLPAEIRKPLEAALVCVLEANELRRAFRVVVKALLREVREVDMALASRIEGALQELSN
jgi:predicted nucleotidyltransferase